MTNIDWNTVANELVVASPGAEMDTRIEAWVQAAIASPTDAAIPALVKALELAESVFVKVRVGSALAIASPNDNSLADSDVADAIAGLITHTSEDDFLYAELLKILGVLATKNTFALANVRKILLRLQATDPGFRLIAAAKVIGWLENAQKSAGLRTKLNELEHLEDGFVQSEIEYQQALLVMSDALLSNNANELQSYLQQACLRFQHAAGYEEQRDDAEAFSLLLGLMLEYFCFAREDKQVVASRIFQKSQALIRCICDPYQQSWYGYRTQREQLLMFRMWKIAELLQRIATALEEVDTWTNFDEALVELAAAYTLLLNADNQLYPLDRALSEVTTKVVRPQLGSLINVAIGRVRLKNVIQHYVARSGEDEIANGLRALLEIAEDYKSITQGVDPELLGRLATLAEREGQEPDFFLKGFLDTCDQGSTKAWFEQHDYQGSALPIDNAMMLGGDPRIDRASRPLVEIAAERLGRNYPLAIWARFTDTVVSLVQIVQQIRDDLPLYTLAATEDKGKEQKGKGQQAGEGDLQEDLFNRLRLAFGNAVGYEITRLAGGRSDTGLKFPECEFPIEVKAEYKDVTRQHVHNCYLAQPDTYASVRDRISFLMILDLRECNAISRVRKPQLTKNYGGLPSTQVESLTKLYSLDESFWVDGLHPDPQIQNASQNVVIVGLVPGNRLKPSSLTTYSQKPRKKQPEDSAGN